MWPASDALTDLRSALASGAGLLVTVAVGWVWGSFLNQLIDRSPYRAGAGPAPGTPPGPPPGVRWRGPPRSLCFGCGTSIPWYENVPALSWLWLRGRCRRCGSPIGLRTLGVELLTPAGFAAVHGIWWAVGAGVPLLLLGLAALSWGLPVAGLALERRRVHPMLWAAGLLLLVVWSATAWGASGGGG